MATAASNQSPPEGVVSEGQEALPLRDNNYANSEEIAPPAYNPDSAIQQPSQIPTGQYHGQPSIAAPAAMSSSNTESQHLNPNTVSMYPAGAVVIPINESQLAPSNQQMKTISGSYPGNATYIVTSSHPPPPHSQLHGYHQPSHHLGHEPPPPRPGQQQPHVVDDPSCLYILAILAFFLPFIGLIAMCMYNCGNGLPPRQAGAFRLLVLSTMVSILIAVIAGSV